MVTEVSTSRGGEVLPNSDPFGQTKRGEGEGVQKLDILHGFLKCMVPCINFPLHGHVFLYLIFRPFVFIDAIKTVTLFTTYAHL